MTHDRRLSLLLSVALAACTPISETERLLTPYDLNARPAAYEGQIVRVAGWLEYGSERRYLIVIRRNGNASSDSAAPGDCTSVEVRESLRQRATELNGRNVVVSGTFRSNLAGERVVLGFCTLAGILVARIDPL